MPGKDIQIMLGHSDVRLTQGLYQHGTEQQQVEAVELLERLFTTGAVSGRCRQRSILSKKIHQSYLEPTEGFEPTTRCLQNSRSSH